MGEVIQVTRGRAVASAALVLCAIGLGVAVATATGPEPPPPPEAETGYQPQPQTEKVTVTEGVVSGARYSARTFTTRDGNVCLEVVGGPAGGVTGTCAAPLTEKKPTLSITDETPGRAERLVVGLALPETKTIDVETDSRRRTLTPRTKEGTPNKWFAFTLTQADGHPELVARRPDGNAIR